MNIALTPQQRLEFEEGIRGALAGKGNSPHPVGMGSSWKFYEEADGLLKIAVGRHWPEGGLPYLSTSVVIQEPVVVGGMNFLRRWSRGVGFDIPEWMSVEDVVKMGGLALSALVEEANIAMTNFPDEWLLPQGTVE